MNFMENVRAFLTNKLQKVSADMVGWLAVLFIHGATIPPIVGLLLGVSDRLPSIDVILFMWTGLMLLFVRSLIMKDILNIITIGVGFMIQATLLGFLVFK